MVSSCSGDGGILEQLALFALVSGDPRINDLLVESPDPAYPN